MMAKPHKGDKTAGASHAETIMEILPPLEVAPVPPDPEGAREVAQDAAQAPETAPEPVGQAQEPTPSGDATGPARRPRGRPRGARTRTTTGEGIERGDTKDALRERIRELEKSIPSNLELTRKSLDGTFGVISAVMVRALGPEAAFTEAERAELADAWAVPLAPYMSGDMEKWLPWLIAGGVTFKVLEPKYKAIQQRKSLELLPGAPDATAPVVEGGIEE